MSGDSIAGEMRLLNSSRLNCENNSNSVPAVDCCTAAMVRYLLLRVRQCESQGSMLNLSGKVSKTKIIDTLWAFFALLGPSLLQLFYTIVAARALNPDEFGRLMLCVSVGTIMMSFSGLGAGGLLLRETARQPERIGDFLGKSIGWTFTTLPIVGSVAIAVMLVMSPTHMPLWLALCIGFSELVSWRIAMNCSLVFVALGQQLRVAVVVMLIPLGRLVAALATMAMSPQNPLFAFAIAYVSSTFVSMLVALWYTTSKTARPRFSFLPFDFLGGASFSLTWFNAAMQVESDKLILAFFTTPGDVAAYAIAARWMDGLYAPTRALRVVLQPKVYRAGAEGSSVAVIKVLSSILPIIFLFGVLAWIGTVVTAPIAVWVFGPKYHLLGHILPLMAALPLVRSIVETGSELFLASDRAGFQTFMQLSATIFRIVISTALTASFGLDGAAYAAIASAIVIGGIYWGTAGMMVRRHRASASATILNEERNA